ncbi:uncharacterized protein METZ01_LOCUS304606 [marine metagenome]|uniref:Uncharacterized protein n=1 Tax=marine metagenome TaxID=408172 RepID=A0A382MW83_9ZZZZ
MGQAVPIRKGRIDEVGDRKVVSNRELIGENYKEE